MVVPVGKQDDFNRVFSLLLKLLMSCRNLTAAFSLWEALVGLKPTGTDKFTHNAGLYLVLINDFHNPYRKKSFRTLGSSQQLLTCCHQQCHPEIQYFFLDFSFTDFCRHISYVICRLWLYSSPDSDLAAN